jgi:hypothetical protein
MDQQERPVAAILLGAFALGLLYWFPARRWLGSWGSTAADLTSVMAGDAAVVDPTYSATLAITVDARPEHIWPWLVQMGYRRGGLCHRVRVPRTVGSWLFMRLIEPAAFLMTRRMLLGLEQRAEALAVPQREPSPPTA